MDQNWNKTTNTGLKLDRHYVKIGLLMEEIRLKVDQP